MKKILFTISYVLLANLAWANTTETLDGIAAVVNNQVVTLSEWKNHTANAEKSLQAQHQPIPKHLSQDVLNDLINQKLMLDYVKNVGITTNDEELQKTIHMIAKDNHLSVSQLYDVAEKNGLPKKKYDEQIREQITLQKVEQQQFGAKIHVTEQDRISAEKKIQQEMQHNQPIVGYHLQHLWIAIPDNATPDQKNKAIASANNARKQLSQGADFATLAKQYATEPADWGMRPVNAIPELFLKALSELKPGQISPVINTSNGSHLIKLIATKNNGGESLSPKAIKDLAQRVAFDEKIKALRAEWVKTLRENSYIKIIGK